jgi:Fe-S-cluster-containing dehydrogenase component
MKIASIFIRNWNCACPAGAAGFAEAGFVRLRLSKCNGTLYLEF